MAESTSPFRTHTVAMTGAWVPYTIPNSVNYIQFKLRTEVAMEYTTHADGSHRVTLPAKTAQSIGSFNTNNQTVYFKATAGTIVEIVLVNLP